MKKIIKIAVGGGKGGVGKSLVASSLAIFFSKKKKVVAVDCDASTPNLNIWLGEISSWRKVEKVSVSEKARVASKRIPLEKYKNCPSKCPFGAMEIKNGKLAINRFLCEGCGACLNFCPDKMIKMVKSRSGEIRIKKTKFGFYLVSGKLYPGEASSGKIVSLTKERAEGVIDKIKEKEIIEILDSPAGVGCSVTATFRDADFAVLVTEPSLAAFSDLEKSISVADHFSINWHLVINKWDINKQISKKIERKYKGKILGHISYDKKIIESVSNLKPVVEKRILAKKELSLIYENFKKRISSNKKRSRYRQIWREGGC